MKPRAVLFDLDGTLSPSKSPMEGSMGSALVRLASVMPVGVISGASFAQFERQFFPGLPSELPPCSLYIFPVSSAEAYIFDDVWRPIYQHRLSNEERSKILGALDEALAEAGLSEPPETLWGERAEDRNSQITFSGLGQLAPLAEKEKWDPDRKKRAPLVYALELRLPEYSIRANAHSSIDITRKGLDKRHGVKKFSECVGVPVDAMLFIGDGLFPGGNDDIVKETGIQTKRVFGPEETLQAITELLS